MDTKSDFFAFLEYTNFTKIQILSFFISSNSTTHNWGHTIQDAFDEEEEDEDDDTVTEDHKGQGN